MILKKMDSKKCFILSCLLAFSFLMLPFLPDGEFFSRLAIFIYSAAMLIVPLLVKRKNMRLFRYLLFIGGILLLLQSLAMMLPQSFFGNISRGRFVFEVIGVALSLLLLGVMMFYSVVEERKNEPVFGCVLAYLLLGTVFGNIYYLIQLHHPASFVFAEGGAPAHADLVYFSFVTLTTCGYGDILPSRSFPRMLAAIEMVCGVMYVAIFIGRMLASRNWPFRGRGI